MRPVLGELQVWRRSCADDGPRLNLPIRHRPPAGPLRFTLRYANVSPRYAQTSNVSRHICKAGCNCDRKGGDRMTSRRSHPECSFRLKESDYFGGELLPFEQPLRGEPAELMHPEIGGGWRPAFTSPAPSFGYDEMSTEPSPLSRTGMFLATSQSPPIKQTAQ